MLYFFHLECKARLGCGCAIGGVDQRQFGIRQDYWENCAVGEWKADACQVEPMLKGGGKMFIFRNLENAEKEIDDLSKGLSTIGKKVDELKASFEVSMKDATQIKIDLDREEVVSL